MGSAPAAVGATTHSDDKVGVETMTGQHEPTAVPGQANDQADPDGGELVAAADSTPRPESPPRPDNAAAPSNAAVTARSEPGGRADKAQRSDTAVDWRENWVIEMARGAQALPDDRRLGQIALVLIAVTVVVGVVLPTIAAGLAWVWLFALLSAWLSRWASAAVARPSQAAASAGYWAIAGLLATTGLVAVGFAAAGYIVWTSLRPGQEWLPWRSAYEALHTGLLQKVGKVSVLPAWALFTTCALVLAEVKLLGSAVVAPVASMVVVGVVAAAALGVTMVGPVSAVTRSMGRLATMLFAVALGCLPVLTLPLLVGAASLALTAFGLKSQLEPATIRQGAGSSGAGGLGTGSGGTVRVGTSSRGEAQ